MSGVIRLIVNRRPSALRLSMRMPRKLRNNSVDIARMIDHDAAVELWDRYKRGEHNVFTRRLYTLQGQQTFEEIRRKYRRDSEFKQTVDRYVEEFERLLAEVSRDETDWLRRLTDGNGARDPLEQALLDFLKSEGSQAF